MNTIDVKIRKTLQSGKVKALVSVAFDGYLVVHDIKIICGADKLFVAMPSRRDEKGVFRDIVHPITQEARQKLEETILNAYYEYLVKNPEPSHPVSFSQKV